MRVIMIDDERAMHLILSKMLTKIEGIDIIGKFKDTESASHFIKEDNNVQLVFVDISMPNETGMQFARRMVQNHPNLPIVFVTSHKEYALDAFDVFAIDYIVKPISFERLIKTIDKVRAIYQPAPISPVVETTKQLFIYCFGGLEVHSKWGEVKWKSRKSAELFGYLLLHQGRMISREQIIANVLSSKADTNVERYLNTIVYQLRKSLETHGFSSNLKSDKDSYGLYIVNAFIDFIEFENTQKKMLGMDISHLEENLEMEGLYRGHLFGEKDYFWAVNDRERLFKLYCDYVKNLSKVLLSNKKQDVACRLLNKIHAYNELDEETVHLLLKTYDSQKDQESFTKLFKSYVKMLKKELGVTPSKEILDEFPQLLQ